MVELWPPMVAHLVLTASWWAERRRANRALKKQMAAVDSMIAMAGLAMKEGDRSCLSCSRIVVGLATIMEANKDKVL